MKHLETLNSSPHRLFGDITDEYLARYLEENFEVKIKDTQYLKDLINLYSYKLLGERVQDAYKTLANKAVKALYSHLDLNVPVDFNILNIAISTYIKLNRKKTHVLNVGEVKEINLDVNIKELLKVKMTKKETRFTSHRINSIAELPRIPAFYKGLPDLLYNIQRRKFILQGFNTLQINEGNLFIDYSMSMVKYRKLLPYLAANINFKNTTINLYVVVKSSVFKHSKVISKKGFLKEIESLGTQYVPGKIDFGSIVKYNSKLTGMSTFLTDGEDIDLDLFKSKTKNFNLLIINKNGILRKYNS